MGNSHVRMSADHRARRRWRGGFAEAGWGRFELDSKVAHHTEYFFRPISSRNTRLPKSQQGVQPVIELAILLDAATDSTRASAAISLRSTAQTTGHIFGIWQRVDTVSFGSSTAGGRGRAGGVTGCRRCHPSVGGPPDDDFGAA